ncbi:hypothetical protein M3Y97_00067900 [Aphelenchoides bicaudatus]|nr:hypothetical protein M3Y97_00067900 [Aphelenchoides bicaudatus]
MPSSEKPDLQEEPTDMGTPQELPPRTIFSLRNDRNILNELVAYESLPFSCAAIICVFAFFVLCVIIVGSFGMILSANYEKSFEDGKTNFSETCASHESWIDVYNSLKDGQGVRSCGET